MRPSGVWQLCRRPEVRALQDRLVARSWATYHGGLLGRACMYDRLEEIGKQAQIVPLMFFFFFLMVGVGVIAQDTQHAAMIDPSAGCIFIMVGSWYTVLLENLYVFRQRSILGENGSKCGEPASSVSCKKKRNLPAKDILVLKTESSPYYPLPRRRPGVLWRRRVARPLRKPDAVTTV